MQANCLQNVLGAVWKPNPLQTHGRLKRCILGLDLETQYQYVCLSIYLSVHLSVHMSINLSVCFHLSIYLFMCLSIYLSTFISFYVLIDAWLRRALFNLSCGRILGTLSSKVRVWLNSLPGQCVDVAVEALPPSAFKRVGATTPLPYRPEIEPMPSKATPSNIKMDKSWFAPECPHCASTPGLWPRRPNSPAAWNNLPDLQANRSRVPQPALQWGPPQPTTAGANTYQYHGPLFLRWQFLKTILVSSRPVL